MKKILFTLLLVFIMGCSPGSGDITTNSSGDNQATSAAPTLTAIPPTHTSTPEPTFTPTITPTAIGGGAGRIAFTSDRDGYPEIYVMNADGSGLVKLANDISPKYSPGWSLDGEKIAFGSDDNGIGSLFVMDADGSNPVKLIDINTIDVYQQFSPESLSGTSPRWSPDGTKIVFKAVHGIGEIYAYAYLHVLNADGSHLSTIALPSWATFDWSPDSQRIVFASDCEGYFGICLMNANGADLVNISHKQGGDTYPAWSPDGKKIAFDSDRNGDAEIFIMNADGSDQINLTQNGGSWDARPVWSPNGQKISFISYRDGNYEIYVMNADGSDQIRVTNHSAEDTNPVWSPDGTKIAFLSDRDGNMEIYVVNADGSNLVRLTDSEADDYSPVWSP